VENFTIEEFTRLANNFYQSRGLAVNYDRIAVDSNLLNYIASHGDDVKKKFKIALCCICLNPPYWEYAREMIQGAKTLFLPGHDVDYFMWSDIQFDKEKLTKQIFDNLDKSQVKEPEKESEQFAELLMGIKEQVNVFPLEPIEWPMPTLMRFHTMLQQEEKLKEYDYVFYIDIDMRFVNVVGDEILGDGLTAAQHPMYALDKTMWPPYEPNEKSAAYIKRSGKMIDDKGRPRFMPLYYAGGIQGGRSADFIEAMKAMKRQIDDDFNKNYVAIWNDESHWNKYLFDNPPSVVLTPSYVYPDSLIKEYYIPKWGCDYQPKIVTLTKKHTLKPLTPEEMRQIGVMK